MKNLAKKGNVPVHIYQMVDKSRIKENKSQYMKQLEKEIGYPMYQKPLDMFGSRGTKLILNRSDLLASFEEILNKEWLFFYLKNYCKLILINFD